MYKPRSELKVLVKHLDRVPHYLFRTSAPKTNGTTSITLVQSAAADNGYDTTDILSRPTSKAAEMLERHCLWKNDDNDNLTSWTSSFLFAIQLAVYRRFNDWDSPDPSSIKVHILDTRRLPRGTFLSAAPLLEAYHVTNPKLIHRYRHAEYLSQGSIVIPTDAMATMTYQSLIDHGLHKLYPRFADEEHYGRLIHRVNQLRNSFKDSAAIAPTTEELIVAQKIAAQWCFFGEMRAVTMATLLSLEPRFRNEPIVLQAFRSNRWSQ